MAAGAVASLVMSGRSRQIRQKANIIRLVVAIIGTFFRDWLATPSKVASQIVIDCGREPLEPFEPR